MENSQLEQTREHIARELLNYLGSLPRELHTEGSEATANVAISIGNFLLWTHSVIEPGKPSVEVDIHERAETVYALGKQFRAVGLKLWGKAPEKTGTLASRIEALEKQLQRLQGGVL